MVHFPSLASKTYEFGLGSRGYPRWVTPFGDPRVERLLAAPQGLSQLATSFIVGRNRGIHRQLLVA